MQMILTDSFQVSQTKAIPPEFPPLFHTFIHTFIQEEITKHQIHVNILLGLILHRHACTFILQSFQHSICVHVSVYI